MIDTVVLTLQREQFAVINHDRFSPSTKGLFQSPYYPLGSRGNFSCYQNPTSQELKQGVYKPRLTATKRIVKGGYSVVLKIEFSIPKLIFGNNFDEVDEKDFECVIEKLGHVLYAMGIVVFPKILREAAVSAIHYSKNIPLTDYSTPYGILQEISKINLTQALDLNQTDFRNEGHSLKFHANSYELVFYDKMKDMDKAKISEKRAIEKDTAIQLELFQTFEPKKPFEVLRMEARFNRREVIKRIFKKLQIENRLIFKEVFDKEISRKVLLLYFELIKRGYAVIAYKPKTAKDFIADFQMNLPKAKIRKMLQIYGLISAVNDMGTRAFREATKSYGKHHWSRLIKDLERCKFKVACPILKPIETALMNFIPLRLNNYCTPKTNKNNWQIGKNAIKCKL